MEATLATLARTFANAFEERARPNAPGENMVRIRRGQPAWVELVVREAHQQGAMLPDDTRYRLIMAVAPLLAEALEEERGEVESVELEGELSVYTKDLLDWLASHPERMGYADEALRSFTGLHGPTHRSMEEALRYAQLLELEEITTQIFAGLRRVMANTLTGVGADRSMDA